MLPPLNAILSGVRVRAGELGCVGPTEERASRLHTAWNATPSASTTSASSRSHVAPDAAPLVAALRWLYFPVCGAAPVSSGPLGGAISVRSRMVPVLE